MGCRGQVLLESLKNSWFFRLREADGELPEPQVVEMREDRMDS